MKKSRHFQFILGFVLGSLIFGSAIAFAAGVIATPSNSKIIVDGKEAMVEAYVIDGRTYLQLRDMAAAIGFDVAWDAESNTVLIDTSKSYSLSEQASSQLQNPQTVTQTKPITKGLAYDQVAASTAPVTTKGLAYEPVAIPAEPTVTGGYGTVYHMLQKGDVVHTEPVETSVGSVAGDYEILRGAEERPWKTSEGLTWPDVPLPEWQSQWDDYPRVEIPDIPPVRFTGDVWGSPYDKLIIFNPYEVERLIRTIYKYAPQNPSLWKDRDPSTNIPNFSIKVEFANDMMYNTFYPFRDWEVEKMVISTGAGKIFRIYVTDTYNLGKFLDVEYFMK